ncbi:MAG: 5-methylcytosine restriction system specificity protein McrC, partial [Crocinitomicaceae bacterium]
KKDEETFIIDTKWKTPWNKSASIEDLRQMYAYGRFWSAKKMILLYPGNVENQNKFKSYLNQNSDGIEHQCKLVFINVFDDLKKLDHQIGHKIFCLLE